jgi:hypothetical protein
MGLITVALFLYAGSTESGWQECCDTVLGMLRGRTFGQRLARVGVFVALPVVTYAGLHTQMTPVFEQRLEFRFYHFNPPRSFTVQGATYFHDSSWKVWVRKPEEHLSSALLAEGVTLHIPPHLVERAGGYTHFQMAMPVRVLDVGGVVDQAEAASPALDGALRTALIGSTKEVNVFVLDQDGRFVGDEAYRVGGRTACCAARMWTRMPPGSHVYIVPAGQAFTAPRAAPGAAPA